ncbi:c-1-tetrahydrofolate synthase, cytoplasmic [Trichonephila inaurata madagascariensis]|uniref:formate--tetrahydrofolate ligase n=1 Tax=Trichonephila inaurata madagascariensis TaxID=2747483 RepID=A0A8X6YYV6_9ARAC|nr:c-1-tetrahydrofolate synthase, cytoplasmic [Trichonephila inaurata madagascariensis]
MPASDILKHPIFSSAISGFKNQFLSLKEQYPNFQPLVTFVQVEQTKRDESSCSDTLIIKSILQETGINCNFVKFKQVDDIESLVLDRVRELNADPHVHGILVQLPDDYAGNCALINNTILPIKDVAGINKENLEKCNDNQCLSSAAAVAVLDIIENAGASLKNSNVFLLGKKSIFCSISQMLLKEKAVVTLCQYCEENSPSGIENANIIISALQNSDKFGNALKPGALLIDCSSFGCANLNESSTIFSSKYFWSTVAVNIAKNTFNAVKNLFQHAWSLSHIPINFGPPGLSDIEITRLQKLKDVAVLAKEIGILPHEIELYGAKKAKVSLSVLERCKFRESGKYVVIAGITPTPLGEGKSTTTVGLCQALAVQLQKNVIACLRQPSQGPTFGIKGGAAGGGYSQVIPMEEFNLHLTGDIHAITAANNLLAAQIDARIFHEATQSDADLYRRLIKVVNGRQEFSKIQIARLQRLGIQKTDPTTLTPDEISNFARLDIDPSTVTWHRVMDTNDRFLRKICIGMAATEKKMTRETQFDIAVASEIMAVLALATDMADMKKKLSKIVVANSRKGVPITVEDLGVTGALAVLLKDAINPNLMQTIEGAPVFVHAGPFANIAHGNSSIIADKLALKLVGKNGFVVTEAGFGSDVGLEKFCDIKCRYSGLVPNVVVIVATIRALKLHGGGPNIASGAFLPKEYTQENLDLVQEGYCNLGRHIEISNKFGLPVVVALNSFSTDTEAELALIKELAEKDGAFRCVICSHFSEGSKGAKDLAEAVVAASLQTSQFKFLYNLETSLENKIETIAKQIYGADGVEFKENARERINLFEKQGFGNLPVCMAKTPLSLSHDPVKKGVPKNFIVPIQDVKLSAGAGFVYPLLGAISTMPGLPTRPCFYDIDIDANTGEIEGLS